MRLHPAFSPVPIMKTLDAAAEKKLETVFVHGNDLMNDREAGKLTFIGKTRGHDLRKPRF